MFLLFFFFLKPAIISIESWLFLGATLKSAVLSNAVVGNLWAFYQNVLGHIILKTFLLDRIILNTEGEELFFFSREHLGFGTKIEKYVTESK